MSDQGFPLIRYAVGGTPESWGLSHGESFRSGIKELVAIRTDLLLAKNPALQGPRLDIEAKKQWEATKAFSPSLSAELDGIRKGADVSITDIVVLNNYTDFRDIRFGDEGCSTAYLRRANTALAGQTWDMHSTARNYVCAIHVPAHTADHAAAPETVLFSLVGCIGLMGYSAASCMIGVNNLNATDARSGIVWPALVRKCLHTNGVAPMAKILTEAEVTSAHNYLIADPALGEMWEIFPSLRQKQNSSSTLGDATLLHTNHCLADAAKKLETPLGQASTSRERMALLERKAPAVKSLAEFYALLTDHEGYPKSICSHFESGAQDPSATCGGAVGDLGDGTIRLWRGCPVYDKNYREHKLRLTVST